MMELRLARHEDCADLARLHAACFDAGWRQQAFADYIAQGWVVIWRDADCIIGCLVLQTVLDEAEILTLCVDPVHRGKGLATSLLKDGPSLIAGFDRVGRMFLEVRADNQNAIHLYERAGFVRIAVRKNYYAHCDGTAMDALVLSRVVNRI